MLIDFARVLLGYLLGSISGSLVLGRFKGVDIRQQGSGNAGGTNALRTQGAWFALGVVIIDVGKAVLAAWLGGRGIGDERHGAIMALAAGGAAVVGHVWPLYHGFRGGKGVATVLGLLFYLWPLGALTMLVVALVVLGFTGFVGLGSITAGFALIPAAVFYAPTGDRAVWLVAAVAAALFILFTHRTNVRRWRDGTEHRFERARVLYRLFRGRPGAAHDV